MTFCIECGSPIDRFRVTFEGNVYCMKCASFCKAVLKTIDEIEKEQTNFSLPFPVTICPRCGYHIEKTCLYFGMVYCEICYDIKLEDHHLLGEYFLEGLRNS